MQFMFDLTCPAEFRDIVHKCVHFQTKKHDKNSSGNGKYFFL